MSKTTSPSDHVAGVGSRLHILSLCSGIGLLDLGIRLACPGAHTVCMVERELFSVAVLAQAMEQGALDPCPVWSDVATFDGFPWRGLVDLVAAGFPCQDISNAGRCEGLDGERSGLFFEVMRVVLEVEPTYVFLENVASLAVRGLDRVLGALAHAGYDAAWRVLRAYDVGAPHERARMFILARKTGSRRGRPPFVGHATSQGLEERGRLPGGPGEELKAPDGAGALPVFPPGPDDARGWRSVPASAQPTIRRVAYDGPSRVDRLRSLGNSVVPLVVAYALATLAEDLE